MTLGLCDEQIWELRFALVEVRRALRKPAARNDLSALLDDIADLADKLAHKLWAINAQTDASHGTALGLIEPEYWQGKRLEDDGPTVAHHLCPRLEALARAARIGREAIPNKPARHKVGDWRPIARIDAALSDGWARVHAPRVGRSECPETVSDMIAYAKANPPAPPYPGALRPSSSPRCVFREIVGICYEAAGGNPDPERALKAYVALVRKKQSEMLAVLYEGLAKAEEPIR